VRWCKELYGHDPGDLSGEREGRCGGAVGVDSMPSLEGETLRSPEMPFGRIDGEGESDGILCPGLDNQELN
jgi:hypothetical protein